MNELTTTEANLPATYEAAQRALAECERVDECKDWSDKAAALAAYARMARNDDLRVLALRIQARAERRCGELLKQIPRGDEATRFGQEVAHPPVTRSQTASDAGLSEHQRKTALRIASVPETEFEQAIESASPPTVTQLAERGKGGRPPRDWSQQQRIKIDVNRIIGVTVMDVYSSATVETVPGGILSLDLGTVSDSDATDWAQMLTEALPILTRLRDRLAEHAGAVCGGNEAA